MLLFDALKHHLSAQSLAVFGASVFHLSPPPASATILSIILLFKILIKKYTVTARYIYLKNQYQSPLAAPVLPLPAIREGKDRLIDLKSCHDNSTKYAAKGRRAMVCVLV